LKLDRIEKRTERERDRENDGGPCGLLIETKTDSYTNTYSEYRLDANSQYNNHMYIQFLSSCFNFPEKRKNSENSE
jgi:hypothetical protein